MAATISPITIIYSSKKISLTTPYMWTISVHWNNMPLTGFVVSYTLRKFSPPIYIKHINAITRIVNIHTTQLHIYWFGFIISALLFHRYSS